MSFFWVTTALLALFAAILWHTCRPKNRGRYEEAKHRMLDDD